MRTKSYRRLCPMTDTVQPGDEVSSPQETIGWYPVSQDPIELINSQYNLDHNIMIYRRRVTDETD